MPIARSVYSLIFHLLIPIMVMHLIWRGLQNPNYFKHWRERFGFPYWTTPKNRLIWIHAVSVGEVQAAKPLILRLLKTSADHNVVVTTTTPTGRDSVKRTFGEDVKTIYLPYDLPFAIKRVITILNPKIVIVMETELWPNLFHYCHARLIPVVIANARLSEHSKKRYRRIASLTRAMLKKVTLFLAQSEEDAKRLEVLGATRENITVIGNLKFDLPPTNNTDTQTLRNDFSSKRNIWIAASTHNGEESIILTAFSVVLKHDPNCLLIIAPRHPHRSPAIRTLCTRKGFNTICKSDTHLCNENVQIFILDSLGELTRYYAIADVAFVGGSLIKHGGHNLLEPASVGVPVLTGPHIFNFSAISRQLLKEGVAWQVNNADELATQLVRLLSDKSLRQKAGEQGRRIVRDNQGSTETALRLIEPILRQHE